MSKLPISKANVKQMLIVAGGVGILGFALQKMRGNKYADQVRAGFN